MKILVYVLYALATLLMFLTILVIPKEYNFIAYLGVLILVLGAIVTNMRTEL
ncbi:hypothetical protein [Phocicoccus schoeneichii]|uniref:hypothetical protein n=1 Tax=Phocicoccus schoeneichii TaxID=1812261 RepID=UPI003D11B968